MSGGTLESSGSTMANSANSSSFNESKSSSMSSMIDTLKNETFLGDFPTLCFLSIDLRYLLIFFDLQIRQILPHFLYCTIRDTRRLIHMTQRQ